MFRLQTNFFGGDTTFLEDTEISFLTLEEAVVYLQTNKPPSEFEWDVREIQDGRPFGGVVAWTRHCGDEVSYWKDGKITTLNQVLQGEDSES